MVAFQQQPVAAAEAVHHVTGDMPQICQHPQAIVTTTEHKLAGLSRIVRYDHGVDLKASYLE